MIVDIAIQDIAKAQADGDITIREAGHIVGRVARRATNEILSIDAFDLANAVATQLGMTGNARLGLIKFATAPTVSLAKA